MNALHDTDEYDLEKIFRTETKSTVPLYGLYEGEYLQKLDNPGSNELANRIYQKLVFASVPFGLKLNGFDGQWWFFDKNLLMGDFRLTTGPSRWRPGTTCIKMLYDIMPLPPFIRNIFYDELQPINSKLILGLGGINADKDKGDHFFFSLRKMP